MSPGNMTERKKCKSSGGEGQPIGLDIGTANIVVFTGGGQDTGTQMEANAFFTVPSMPNTRKILEGKAVRFLEKDDRLHILGNAAEEFSNILGGATRRPMENGLVNLREDDGIHVIQAILDPMVPEPDQKDHHLWFSVPGDPLDRQGAAIFNESIFKTYLKGRGYVPRPINEAMAVVVAELTDQHATGIGISMGGGDVQHLLLLPFHSGRHLQHPERGGFYRSDRGAFGGGIRHQDKKHQRTGTGSRCRAPE